MPASKVSDYLIKTVELVRIIEESDYWSDGYKHSCDWLNHLTLLMLIAFTAFSTAFNKKKTQKKSVWFMKFSVMYLISSPLFLWL